jgi:hypothetical protein
MHCGQLGHTPTQRDDVSVTHVSWQRQRNDKPVGCGPHGSQVTGGHCQGLVPNVLETTRSAGEMNAFDDTVDTDTRWARRVHHRAIITWPDWRPLNPKEPRKAFNQFKLRHAAPDGVQMSVDKKEPLTVNGTTALLSPNGDRSNQKVTLRQ